jgi:TP901 family phage tail tape measure protein
VPNVSRTIDIIFNGIDNTAAAARSVVSNLDGIDDAAEAIAGPIADVTAGLLALEAAALATAFALGKSAYDASIRFESAQIELAKVLTESDGTVESFTQGIIELSNQYGVSSTTLLRSVADFRQAGFAADESATLVADALNLVIAGELETAEASEILVRTLKGFNLEASEAARIVDILAAVSATYATDAGKLGEGLAALAPIAGTLGFTLEETAGLLTPIIERFQSGNEAATALRTGLNRLISPVSSVTDELARLGVSQVDSTGQLRSVADILGEVQIAFQGLSREQQLLSAQQIVGVEQSGRLVAVFQELDTTTAVTATALDSAGKALQEVETALQGGEAVANRTATAFENLQVAIGSQFRDEVKGVVDAFGEVFRVAEQAVREEGALEELFLGLAPLIKEVEDAVLAFAEVLPESLGTADFTPFVEAFDAILSLFRGSDLTTVDGLVEALEGLAQSFLTLTNFSVGVVDFFQGLAQIIGPLAKAFGDLDSETVQWLGAIGGVALTVGPLVGIFNALGGALGGLAKLGGIAGSLGSAASLTTLGVAVGQLAGPLGIGLLTFELTRLTGAGEALNEAFGPGEDSLGTWIYGLINDGPDAANSLDSLTNSTEDLTSAATEFGTGGGFGFQEVSETANEASKSLDKVTLSGDAYAKSLQEIGDRVVALGKETDDTVEVTEQWVKNTGDVVTTYTQLELTGRTAVDTVTDATEKSEKAIDKATAAAADYQLKLEEIASNERIANIEAQVSLNIAEVEANAQILEATMVSLSETINSTGSLISDLFSLQELPEWDRFGFEVQRQIEDENEIRKQAAEDQSKLTQAQIDALRARTRSLERGDALIEISGDGLEPELEAFMWAILRKIQVRANADGAEFLLGIA